ncbi:MAG TPA: nucleotidyl transferase AbiEii/AbiGii toxin family protein [Myxococcota bacterium]|nr:nucleotidyl transferase AbiEii/AbiGii toxin family protein [Myxococcota bacterium]
MNERERQAFSDLREVVLEMSWRCLLVGAHARDACLPRGVQPPRRTTDVDMAVLLSRPSSEEDIQTFLKRCESRFDETQHPLRLRHRTTGVPVDVLVCGEVADVDHMDDRHTSMVDLDVGTLRHCFERSEAESADPTLPTPPLPIFVLLKLVAWRDRRLRTDLADIGYVLRHHRPEQEPFDDDDFTGMCAREELGLEDHPCWVVGRDLAEDLPAAGRRRLLDALSDLERARLETRAALAEYLKLSPDDRLVWSDRMLRVLLFATRVEGTPDPAR